MLQTRHSKEKKECILTFTEQLTTPERTHRDKYLHPDNTSCRGASQCTNQETAGKNTPPPRSPHHRTHTQVWNRRHCDCLTTQRAHFCLSYSEKPRKHFWLLPETKLKIVANGGMSCFISREPQTSVQPTTRPCYVLLAGIPELLYLNHKWNYTFLNVTNIATHSNHSPKIIIT